MPRVTITLSLAAAMLLAGCKLDNSSTGRLLLQDDCDPATFNAALGAGACAHSSSAAGVTLTAFTNELTATRQVAAWQIFPPELAVNRGDVWQVANVGGETHTYTEVAAFGGGVVPQLNQLSGNNTVAPECANAATVDSSTVRSGQTISHTFDESGVELYQCCIHPWMRQTVTIR